MIVSPAQLLRVLAVVVFLVAWAVLAHFGTAGESHPDLSVLLGVAPIIAALGLLLWRSRHPLLTGGGIALMLGGLAWLWPTLRQNIPLLFFVQHVGTNLALATLFGRSLLGDGDFLLLFLLLILILALALLFVSHIMLLSWGSTLEDPVQLTEIVFEVLIQDAFVQAPGPEPANLPRKVHTRFSAHAQKILQRRNRENSHRAPDGAQHIARHVRVAARRR
jgi:hypothetical protein